MNDRLEELRGIYHGVYLIRDLTAKTSDAIVSYGERLSSRIVTALIKGAVRMDARRFIKTARKGNKTLVDFDVTNRLIREQLRNLPRVTVVPGFISADVETGVITNLAPPALRRHSMPVSWKSGPTSTAS